MNTLRSRSMLPVAMALKRHRAAVRRCLFQPLVPLAKWQQDIHEHGVEHVTERELGPPVDYLARYFTTGSETWRSLYLGHMLEQVHLPGHDENAALALKRKVLAAQRDGLMQILAPAVGEKLLAEFDRILSSMHAIVTREMNNPRVVRVLFIGDCLLENLAAFLIVPLLECEIELRSEYIVSKTPGEIERALQARESEHTDLVCYSPYSNLFNPILLRSINYRNPFMSGQSAATIAGEAHMLTRSILGIVSKRCSCTISVQNTNNMLPDFQGLRRGLRSLAKRILSRRGRESAAAKVNLLLDDAIAEFSESRQNPLVKVDEVALKNRFGERALRKRFYDSAKHHPAVLAEKLSATYLSLILANQLLRGKKVIVIDLDETVWKGVIGEGRVKHHEDRQAILRGLRQKGILLSIASKNDPKNVHWTGGVLESTDFVAEQISWAPKPASIRRIAEELNLKLKDFVFIDDRADEREMVKISIPEIEVLDATAGSSWEMLRAWAVSLPRQTEGDRTQLYRERKQRESYLNVAVEVFDEKAMFAALGIKVDFHMATVKEFERVAELINRTNQFNTTARRASLQQVKGWAASANHRILVAQAGDKFGAMGIISAMVVQLTSESAQVSSWVLSCRVFGYGIEIAMLNALRRAAGHSDWRKLTATIVETPHNQPCRDVFARNGFQLREDIWHSDCEIEIRDPEWLEIAYGEGFDAIRNTELA